VTVNFGGNIYDDAGNAVSGASVKLLETGTTTQEGSTVTSDSNGRWDFLEADQDRYDVEITKGSSVRRIKWSDEISLQEIDVRNNTGAAYPAATFTNLTNSITNQVAVFSGANSTKADGDEIYLSFKLHDSAGNLDEFARMTVEATDVTTTTEDGQIRFGVIVGGTLTDVFTIDSSTGGAATISYEVDSFTIKGGEGEAGVLYLMADQGDDAGDAWKINIADGGVLTIGNDIASAGTYVTFLTLSPHATTASSTVAIVGDATVGDDLSLTSDNSVFNMGAGNDFTITHDGTTGATLAGNPITITASGASTWSTSSGALTITSAAAATWSTGAGALTIDGDDGIILQTTGTGNVTVSEILDITDATDSSDASGDTGALRTEGGASIAKSLWVGSGLDVDGIANLDAVDIDGTVQVDGPITVGINTNGEDVKFFGAASNTYMLWDENTDDLVLALGAELYFYDAAGGEHIKSDGTDMTIYAGTDLNLTAVTDINIPADVGLTFGNDGEKIEGNGTDLTIAGNNINLTATADVVIPADVGITFGSGEKVIPANVGITFGSGEKIEGDSTDLTITSGAKINLTATSDVVIPANVGVTFGSGEKIEGDSTDLTITSGGDIVLASTENVFINDTANGKMTTGLTINMGAADDENVALKSSDVGHSFTDDTEADTFCLLKKASAAAGGLILDSYIDTGANSFYLRGRAVSANTTKSTSAYAPIHLQGSILATNTAGTVSSNGNLATIDNLYDVKFIFDAEGDLHLDAGGGAGSTDPTADHSDGIIGYNVYDDQADWQMARALHASLVPETDFGQEHKELVERFRPLLEDRGIVSYNDNGHHFIAMKRLALFQLDAMYQIGEAVMAMATTLQDAGMSLPENVNKLLALQGAA